MIYIENINFDGGVTIVFIIGAVLFYFFRNSSKK